MPETTGQWKTMREMNGRVYFEYVTNRVKLKRIWTDPQSQKIREDIISPVSTTKTQTLTHLWSDKRKYLSGPFTWPLPVNGGNVEVRIRLHRQRSKKWMNPNTVLFICLYIFTWTYKLELISSAPMIVYLKKFHLALFVKSVINAG